MTADPRFLPVMPTAAGSEGGVPGGGDRPLDDLEPDPAAMATIRPRIVDALRTVYDPELPVNIYDLGLVYDVIVDRHGVAGVRMTLTAPACPAAQVLPGQVRDVVRGVEGVTDARVQVVWDPPWSRDRMSEAARLELGMMW